MDVLIVFKVCIQEVDPSSCNIPECSKQVKPWIAIGTLPASDETCCVCKKASCLRKPPHNSWVDFFMNIYFCSGIPRRTHRFMPDFMHYITKFIAKGENFLVRGTDSNWSCTLKVVSILAAMVLGEWLPRNKMCHIWYLHLQLGFSSSSVHRTEAVDMTSQTSGHVDCHCWDSTITQIHFT